MCVCVCVSHSVMSDSLWPHGLQSARLLCPWNSPDKNPAVGCISFSNANCSGSSVVAKSRLTLATPQTVACQVLLSMGFSRQEYWRVGCHFLLHRMQYTRAITQNCIGSSHSFFSLYVFWQQVPLEKNEYWQSLEIISSEIQIIRIAKKQVRVIYLIFMLLSLKSK